MAGSEQPPLVSGRPTRVRRRCYSFQYVRGAEQARAEADFEGLISFPEWNVVHDSKELFPLFSNRVVPRSRPGFAEYLSWLSIPQSLSDPVAILSRSGGVRVTDSCEVFPLPEPNERGEYEVHFLVHGLSHMPAASTERVLRLEPGEPLSIVRDCQDPIDPLAIALRAAERFSGDLHFVGYCPRYLTADFVTLLDSGCPPAITVERMNPPPAPLQVRLLCKATMRGPEGFRPYSGESYESLAQVRAPAEELTAVEG